MPKFKFKKGNTVKLIANTNQSVNKVGDVGVIVNAKITACHGYDYNIYDVRVPGGPDYCAWSKEDEIELVTTKFKVGDIVIGNKKADKEYSCTVSGYIGKVIRVKNPTDSSIEVSRRDTVDIQIAAYNLENHSIHRNAGSYWVMSECFDLHTSAESITNLAAQTKKAEVKVAPDKVAVTGEFIALAMRASDNTIVSVIKSGAPEYFKDFNALVKSFKLIGFFDAGGSTDQISAILKDKEYLVPVEAVRKAYKLACLEWKTKLEDKFPEVFTAPKVFKFNLYSEPKLSIAYTDETPLVIGNCIRPYGYNHGESLYVNHQYKAEIINEGSRQFIVFKRINS